MSFDCRFKWLMIAVVALSGCLIATAKGFLLATLDVRLPVLIAAGLWGFHWLLRYRGFDGFGETMKALSQFIAYTSCFIPLTYAVCASQRPLCDDGLMAFDAACGFHLPSIVAWAQQHPNWQRVLTFAYDSVILQTVFVFLFLGIANQGRELRQFSSQLLLGSLLTAGVLALFPADGPFTGYGYEPSAAQAQYLKTFHALRAGQLSAVDLSKPEGLVTFPSFHTTWAIVLAFAFRRNRWIFPAALLLNLLVVVSTLTTGWHYFADVVAGGIVGGVAIAISIALDNYFAKLESQAAAEQAVTPSRRWSWLQPQTTT